MNTTLNLVKGCCSSGPALSGMISPYRRAVALEWGGSQEGTGPVSGVVQCSKCFDCWKFTLLGAYNDVRIFGFAKIGDNAMSILEREYGKLDKPSWPIWIPMVFDKIKCADRDTFERLESSLMDRSGPPNFVFATKHLINGRVLAYSEYDPSVRDWVGKLVTK